MMDLVYFGYTHEDDSARLQKQFIEEVKEVFPDVELKDAYDDIKGYRQEVHLPDEQEEAYFAWIFAESWEGCSLSFGIMKDPEKMKRILDLAIQTYPDNFEKKDDSNTAEG